MLLFRSGIKPRWLDEIKQKFFERNKKMKGRTVSTRNLIGAFLGGALGILAFGYLHPAVLPFGCLFGVVVGWWYEEIWKSITDSVSRGIAGTRHAWSRFTTFTHTPVKKLSIDIGPGLTILHFFVCAFVWFLSRPIAFIRWLRAHPINRAYAIRTLAVLSYFALNILAIVSLAFATISKDSVVMPLLFMIGGIGFLLGPLGYLISDEETLKMRKFYLVWERYSASGPFWFFIKDLVNIFRYEISSILATCGTLIWFFGIGGAFLLLVVIPISVAVGAIKGIYEVSMRAGHWLCFGTTVVVTALTAWIAYPYLNDVRVLWIAALFAGLASAVVTEGLRYSLVWFFSISERTQAVVSETLWEKLTPSGCVFLRITTTVGNKFLNVLPRPV